MTTGAFRQRYEFPADGLVGYKGKQWRCLPSNDKRNRDDGHAFQDMEGLERTFLSHDTIDRLIKAKTLCFQHGQNSEQSVTLKRARQTREFEKYSKQQTDLAWLKKRILFHWDDIRGPNASREQSILAIDQAHKLAFAEANDRALKNGTQLRAFKTRSLAALYAWKSELENASDAAKILIDQRDEHSGNFGPRMTLDQERILDLLLQRWLTTDKKNAKTVFTQLTSEINFLPELADLKGVKWPHMNTFLARKNKLGQADRDYYRIGAEYFQKAYHSTGAGIGPARPGMLLQIDGMEFDTETICGSLAEYRALDRKKRRALKKERVIVVAIICVATRSILGFAIGFGETTRVTKKALRMAFSDKSGIAEAAGCKGLYPQRASGAARIVSDNGTGFLEEFTASALDTYSVHQKAVVGVPWLRAHIERFFRTLAHKFFQIFTGRMFGDVRTRTATLASILTKMIPRLFTRYIVDVYHHTTHRGIGLMPYTAWRLMSEASPPPPPYSDERLSAIFGVERVVPVGPDGVEVNGFQYHSLELQDVFEHLGPGHKVTIRHDVEDVSRISVRLPQDYVRQLAERNADYRAQDLLWISVPSRAGLRGVSLFAAEKVSDHLLQEYGATPAISLALAQAGNDYLFQVAHEMRLQTLFEEDVSPEELTRLRRKMHPGLLQMEQLLQSADISSICKSRPTGGRAHELVGLVDRPSDHGEIAGGRGSGKVILEPEEEPTRTPKPHAKPKSEPHQISVVIPKKRAKRS